MIRRLALAVGIGLIVGIAAFFLTLPDVRPLKTSFPKTTAFMEHRKAELGRRGESPRLDWRPVTLFRIAPSLRRAVLAAEDARFYEHDGIDWRAVREAARRDWEGRHLRRGGSTITQQLAKNLYLSPTRSPWRKLREWAITRRLERELPKTRILELYLNVIELGPRTYGVEAASRRYFGKPALSLTLDEAARLAALIPSPRTDDPLRHPSRLGRRARRILRAMGNGQRPTLSKVETDEDLKAEAHTLPTSTPEPSAVPSRVPTEPTPRAPEPSPTPQPDEGKLRAILRRVPSRRSTYASGSAPLERPAARVHGGMLPKARANPAFRSEAQDLRDRKSPADQRPDP